MTKLREPKNSTSLVEDASVRVIFLAKALRKNWPFVIACLIFATGVSFFYTKSLAKIYDATALVELNATVMRPLGDKGEGVTPFGGMFWDNQEYYETQYKIVVSQRVLTQVV